MKALVQERKSTMKKLISAILTLAVALGLGVPALAAEQAINTEGTHNISIVGTGSSSYQIDKLSFVVAWESMSFEYTAGNRGTWNPGTHSFEGKTDGSWTTEKRKITVTNHSNVKLEVRFGFAGTGGITGSFSKSAFTVESADQEQYRTPVEGVYPAPMLETQFGIDSTSAALSVGRSLGTLTVSVQKHTPTWSFSCTGASAATLEAALDEALSLDKTKLTVDMSGLSDSDAAVLLRALDGKLGSSNLGLYVIELSIPGLKTVPGEGPESSFNFCDGGRYTLKTLSLPDATSFGFRAFEGMDTISKLELTAADRFLNSEDAFYGFGVPGYTALVLHEMNAEGGLPRLKRLARKKVSGGCVEYSHPSRL